MRTLCLSLGFFLLCPTTWLFSQEVALAPTARKALIMLEFFDSEGEPVQYDFELVGRQSGESIKGSVNAEGKIQLLLPVGDDYDLHIAGHKNYDLLSVANLPFRSYILQVEILPELLGQLLPSESEAVVNFSLKDFEGNILDGETIMLKRESSDQDFHGITDADGKLTLKLPNGEDYIVSFQHAPDYVRIDIPEVKNLVLDFDLEYSGANSGSKYPSLTTGLINFRFYDYRTMEKIGGELFTVTNARTGEQYTEISDENGLAQVVVPLGDPYTLSHKYNPNFRQGEVKAEHRYHVFILNVDYESVPSGEREAYIRFQEQAEAIRDSLARNIVDFWADSPEETANKIAKTTERVKSALQSNSNLFTENRNTVLSVFDRVGEKWRDKTVVTDLTCSMDPYMEEILVWQGLDRIEGESTKYVFFNDGDGKPNRLKEMGKTGGIYQSNSTNMVDIITVMMQTKIRGCSGDKAENDLEALLSVASGIQPKQELILIADNYSNVRDIELLDQLNIPVRIILCGTEGRFGKKPGANPQYLTIARRTGGSIHTMQSDLWDLSELREGDEIVINNQKYLVQNNEFIPVR